jgi:hypothetical protein
MHGFLVEAEEDEDYSLDLKGRQRGRWRAWSPTEDERRGLVENFTKASCRGKPLILFLYKLKANRKVFDHY